MAKSRSRPQIGEPTGFEEMWRERHRNPSQTDPEDDDIEGLPRYMRAISSAPFLPAWVETLLFERMEAGDRGAKARLVVSHLRLVASIASEHLDRGLSIEDLIQEGNLGLERAVEKFDFRRGTRLSSYATPAIEMAIIQAIADTGRTIRVPLYARRRLARIARVEDSLWSELRRPPTRGEVAEVTGYSPDEIDWLRRDTLPPSSFSELPWDETEELLDQLPDATQLTPDQEYLEWETAETLDTALEKLSDRERQIIKWRVGWESPGSRSLAEISLELGISRERVRQIEAEALAKLRSIIEASEKRAQLKPSTDGREAAVSRLPASRIPNEERARVSVSRRDRTSIEQAA